MITKLTDEQIEAFEKYRQKWMEIGLDTRPIDQEKAKAAVLKAYECAGHAAPRYWIFLDSPVAGAIAAHVLTHVDNDEEVQATDGVDETFSNGRGDVIFERVKEQLREQGYETDWDSAYRRARSLFTSTTISAQLDRAGYGSHEAGWLAFYDYFWNELHLECCAGNQGLFEVSEECGWWWPFEEAVIVTSKMTHLHKDEDMRLHAEDGPALAFPDGWGSIYSWHGIRVPEHVIERPEEMTIEELVGETNSELRRIMFIKFGVERLAREGKFEVVHRDECEFNFPAIPISDTVTADQRLVTGYRKGKEVVELLRSTELVRGDDLPVTLVKLSDPSTGEVYYQRCDPEATRAYEAVASLVNMTEKEYKEGMFNRQGDVLLKPLKPRKGESYHS